MNILAIDTSCDETSIAVTYGYRVLSNVVSSQVRQHRQYGGIVPFLAQRLHKERIEAVVTIAVERAKLTWQDIGAIAVTYGPGLAPALEVGLEYAKKLSKEHNLPLYGVDHMAGHIASCYAQVGSKQPKIEMPCLALLVSGGHTELVYFEKFGIFQIIGQTLDDALGEAYDKLAKMLGLGYPGGRLVSQRAFLGDSGHYSLPIPLQYSKDLNFSFSGLKNAARLLILAVKQDRSELTEQEINDICASFERVAQESVLLKVEKALKAYPEVKTLLLGGGVAANKVLRRKLRILLKKYRVKFAMPLNMKLCTDNAAMIGVAAGLGIKAGQKPVLPGNLDRKPGLSLEESSL